MPRLLVESTGNPLRITAQIPGRRGGDRRSVEAARVARGTADGPLSRSEVEVRGEAQLAQKFRELVLSLRPDPEEELLIFIGDVAVHRVGPSRAAHWIGSCNAAATLLQDVRRVLQPPAWRSEHLRGGGEQFLRGVDALREDLDPSDARLELLKLALGAK